MRSSLLVRRLWLGRNYRFTLVWLVYMSTRRILSLLLVLCYAPALYSTPVLHDGGGQQLHDDLQQILAAYRRDSNWFAADTWLPVQVKGQKLNVPVYPWVARLVPSRLQGENLYQVCSVCFLGDDKLGRNYVREQHTWGEQLREHWHEARQLLRPSWWRNTIQRGHGFLHRLYHERGVLSTVLVGLTWLPYTAITEGVIEPMLIGPLHTICPLFQVAYFGTLNFTHTLYKNVQHTLTFGGEALTLPRRLRLSLSGWRRLPRSTWQIAGQEIESGKIEHSMAAELGDAVMVQLLSSAALRPVLTTVLLATTEQEAAKKKSEASEHEAIYRELTHAELWRRVYFVEMTVSVARTLLALSAKHLDLRLHDKELAAAQYRRLQGQLGKLHRGMLALEFHLKKLIVITRVLDSNYRDMVLVDFQRSAQLTQQVLQALLANLDKIFHLQTSEDTSALFAQRMAEFAEYDFIVDVTAKK